LFNFSKIFFKFFSLLDFLVGEIGDNEDIAKSVTGQIQWLSSFGSPVRFDSYSAGVYPGQDGQIKIFPSQERVPKLDK
jgi:hypothetical protein